MKLKIFISSVQKEFAEERKLLKRYISKNPAYRRFFDTFVFEEDVVAVDRRADEVYLDELGKCDIYIGLIGNEYGFEDVNGVSPTEREFDEATRLGLPRLVFVLDRDATNRHPKETAFLKKISATLIRAKCSDPAQLMLEIYASLDGMLVEQGAYRMGPFDASPCDGATMADIDESKVRWFVNRARQERNASLETSMSTNDVLTHLRLVSQGGEVPTNAAILLFGRDPQRFYISSEVKCAQWYGTERLKPMLSYQIYRGNLFDMADAAIAFVLSKLDLRVGTRNKGSEAPREYDIPEAVVAEAIINAIAHRDYTSSASVQVELFSDRLVVRNPGRINPAISKADLFVEHSSYPNNNLIADQLYLTNYIEKFGTGFTDLIDGCRSAGLLDPDVDDSRCGFTLTIWRKRSQSALVKTNKKTTLKTRQKTTLKTRQKSALCELLPGVTAKRRAMAERILSLMKSDPHITYEGLMRELKLSHWTINNYTKLLKENGLLVRRGGDKGGIWEVVEIV